MSTKNKIGIGMIILLFLITLIGNFLDGFLHGMAFIAVLAWVVIALELLDSKN